jgi:hypothetical protein
MIFMKKIISKLTSLISSAILCTTVLSAINSNAEYYTIWNGDVIPAPVHEVSQEMYDFLIESDVFLKNHTLYTLDGNGNIDESWDYENYLFYYIWEGRINFIYASVTDSQTWEPFSDCLYANFEWDEYVCNDEEEVNALQEYLSENYPEITVTVGNLRLGYYHHGKTYPYLCKLTYNGELLDNDNAEFTVEDKFQLAQNIFNELGIPISEIGLLEGVSSPLYLEGDINQSGSIDITDVVNIMSYAANPEKYPIDEIGQVLGDVYNKGDGINNMDALQIQKYLANEITDLTTTE